VTKQSTWPKALSKGLVNIRQLSDKNLINSEDIEELTAASELFDIRVPHVFVDKILDQNSALSKQFIPSTQELVFIPEELTDPIGDEPHSPVPGITHRYPNRVLLKPTYLCASYCRFCFRRYKVSKSECNLSEQQYSGCLEYLKSHKEIWEVILTGGDPLVLHDKKIRKIIDDLSQLSHIKVIRIHTRIPSVLPERITSDLIEILKSSRQTIWIALHANHADEFTSQCKEAIGNLIQNGFPVVLQSVLLKGINDSFTALRNLFEVAVENKVRPYYLHYPDLAKGTSHFRMSIEEAQKLFSSLRGKISGLCLPMFVLDIPGGRGKIIVEKSRIWYDENGRIAFDSPL